MGKDPGPEPPRHFLAADCGKLPERYLAVGERSKADESVRAAVSTWEGAMQGWKLMREKYLPRLKTTLLNYAKRKEAEARDRGCPRAAKEGRNFAVLMLWGGYGLGEGDEVAAGILDAEFAHAVKRGADRHDDFHILHGSEHSVEIVHL